MRNILIVTPHFPPVDAVDMHRIRMNVAYYSEFGWQPTILSVLPEYAGRIVDERLCVTLPEYLEIQRVKAIPERIAKMFGISAIGIRAHGALARAGDALIRNGKFDLVFFSTTAFPVMTLGPRWCERFGIHYVLDLQDPWYTTPYTAPRRGGAKSRVMQALHRRMEMKTIPNASGLIAVSRTFIDTLRTAYNLPQTLPSATIPFGYSANDFNNAPAEVNLKCNHLRSDSIVCIYAGRINPEMIVNLRVFLDYIHLGKKLDTDNGVLNRLSIIFLGTGYQKSQNPSVVLPLANSLGLKNMVIERPERIPFLDVQRALLDADLLLIIGSDDITYQPSKLFPYLYLEKPLICVTSGMSRLAEQVRDLDGVYLMATEQPVTENSAQNFTKWLGDIIKDVNSTDYSARRSLVQGYEARELARQECAVFDDAMSLHND